jgi:hypothetical protein
MGNALPIIMVLTHFAIANSTLTMIISTEGDNLLMVVVKGVQNTQKTISVNNIIT